MQINFNNIKIEMTDKELITLVKNQAFETFFSSLIAFDSGLNDLVESIDEETIEQFLAIFNQEINEDTEVDRLHNILFSTNTLKE